MKKIDQLGILKLISQKHPWSSLPLILIISSCCELQIDQVCYRTAHAGQIRDLGIVGHKRANLGFQKGFEAVGFPKIPSDIPLTISEMKLITNSNGEMSAKGTATSESIKEIVDAGGGFSKTWDNSSSMVVRTISFESPYLYRNALNSPENEAMRTELRRQGSQARVVARIVRAFDHSKITSSTFTGALSGSLATTSAVAGPSVAVNVDSTRRTEKEVIDGSIIGYEWYKVIWSKSVPNMIDHLKLDSTFLD